MSNKKHEPRHIDWQDMDILVCHVLNLNPESITAGDIEEEVYDKFSCTVETFHKIVEHLVPLCWFGRAPENDILYQGFSKQMGNVAQREWLVKHKI